MNQTNKTILHVCTSIGILGVIIFVSMLGIAKDEAVLANGSIIPTPRSIYLALVLKNFNPAQTPTFTTTSTLTPTATSTPTPTTTPTPTITPTPTALPCGSLVGIISTDTILTENCDYLITGNVLVLSGITLTIRPGVHILFDGPYYLEIEGTLKVEGTADRRVVFTSRKNVPMPGDWIGIHVIGSSVSSISYAIIEYAGLSSETLSGALYLKNGAHVVDNVTIRKNKVYPLIISDGDITFENSTVTENQGGTSVITLEGNLGATNIISNVVTLNSGYHVINIAKWSPQRQSFINNRIEQNTATDGGILYVQGSSVEIKNDLFINNISSPRLSSSVISIQSEAISNTISCNTFQGNQISANPPQNSATIYVSYDNQLEVSQNNFYPGLAYYELSVGSFASTDIDATNNYWGTTNPSEIANRIYDFYDDFNLVKINFTPFLSTVSVCAPPP